MKNVMCLLAAMVVMSAGLVDASVEVTKEKCVTRTRIVERRVCCKEKCCKEKKECSKEKKECSKEKCGRCHHPVKAVVHGAGVAVKHVACAAKSAAGRVVHRHCCCD